MPEATGKGASVQVEVVFLEIEALHDLPGRRLVGSADEPRVAIDNDLRDLLFVDYYRMPQFVDEAGAEVEGARDDVAGMYGAMRAGEGEPFWRTFSRKRTSPIDRKYVYVFSADSPAGGNLQLEHELYFDKGQIRVVEFQANTGSDVRRPGSARRHGLRLDVVRTIDGRKVHPAYFALLAPMQLPWRRLQEILRDGSAAARASRVGDAFWTDGFTGADPSTAKTFHELFRGGRKPDTLGLVLYLVDPFKEALRRVDTFQKNLDGWIEKQKAMASDEGYVLARRVDLLAHACGLEANVNPALPAYLLDAERELFTLRLAAEDACESLLRWTGQAQQHDRIEGVDVCYRNRAGNEYHAKEVQSYPAAPCNPFSEAVRDYLDAGGDACEVAKNVTHAVQSRLGETTVGVAWMNEVFDELVAGRFPVATAGAELLFDGKRKGAGGDLWAPLFRCWAPVWARRYGREATRNLEGWLEATHGIDVATRDPKMPRIDADKTRLPRLGDAAARDVVLGFHLFNAACAMNAVREEQESRLAVEQMGAIGDSYAEAARLYEKVEQARGTFRYAGATKVPKVAPLALVFASTLDSVLAGRDRLNAKTDSERIGHGLRALGSALTLASAASASGEVPRGVGLLIAELVLESAGSFLVAEIAPTAVFLRHCEWGSGGGWSDREGNLPGYQGKLAELAGDRSAQGRLVHELVYDYQPKLELRNEPSSVTARSLVLRTGMTGEEKRNPLGAASRWAIELSIDHGDGRPPEKWSFRADGRVSHVDASVDAPILVKMFTKHGEAPPHARARITVTGTARLDPLGTGRYFIERKIEGTFDLGWVGR
jgi:hypothetical protein